MTENEWMKTSEIAKLLGVHVTTVADWVKAGYFPGAQKNNPFAKNAHYRVPRASVEVFMKARELTPENKPEE
jgi:predicted site-specific integrase-resolvase